MPNPSSGRGSAPPPQSGRPGYFSRQRWATTSWGLGDVATGFVVGVVASNLVGALLILAAGADPKNIPLWIQVVAEIPLWAAFIGVPVLATRLKGDGPVADLGLRMRWYDVPLGVAIGAFGQQVLVGLVYWPIFKVFGRQDVSQVAQDLTRQAHGLSGEVLLLGLVSVGAPIAEEIFFRGLTQRSLLKQRRLLRANPWAAIVLTAAFFGAAHFEPLQFPALFAFGLVLGVLAWRTERLGPGIWAHLTFNALAASTLIWNLHLPTFSP